MRSSLLILILITLAVAACQPAPPATTEAPPPMETQVETQSPLPTVERTSPPAGVTEAYPPPQKSGQEAYPAPGQAGAAITWEEAVALILEGKVAEVIQNQSLTVNLTLKDGQVFTTTEPLFDQVLQIIEQCGAICQDIVQKTE